VILKVEFSFHDNHPFLSEEKLSDRNLIVTYKSNRMEADETDWNAPNNSAVHLSLSAAITAYSRIHTLSFLGTTATTTTATTATTATTTTTDSVVLG